MPPKKKTGKITPKSDLNFEQALSKIEEIVESMESEELPLEDLVAQYEAGSKLLKQCTTILTSAKQRIELITLEDQKNKSSENPSTNSPPDTGGDPDDPNDISLF